MLRIVSFTILLRSAFSQKHPLQVSAFDFLNSIISPLSTGNGAGVLVAGYNDAQGFSGSPTTLSGVARSTDWGVTWTDLGRLPSVVGGSVFGDPSVKVWNFFGGGGGCGGFWTFGFCFCVCFVAVVV